MTREEEADKNWPWILHFTPLLENGEKLFEIVNEIGARYFDKVIRIVTESQITSDRYAGRKFFGQRRFENGKLIFELDSFPGDSDSNGSRETFRIVVEIGNRLYSINFIFLRDEFFGDSSDYINTDFYKVMEHPRLKSHYSKFIEDIKAEVRKLVPEIKFQPH